jgi:hypothetical protein
VTTKEFAALCRQIKRIEKRLAKSGAAIAIIQYELAKVSFPVIDQTEEKPA